jgi:hypothetical protein
VKINSDPLYRDPMYHRAERDRPRAALAIKAQARETLRGSV